MGGKTLSSVGGRTLKEKGTKRQYNDERKKGGRPTKKNPK